MIGNLFFMLLLERVGPYDNQYASVPTGSAFAPHRTTAPPTRTIHIDISQSESLHSLFFFSSSHDHCVKRRVYLPLVRFDTTHSLQLRSHPRFLSPRSQV